MSSHQSRVGDCSVCGEKVSTPSFSCVECRFSIHQKCAEAPVQIYHPFHLGHPLLLQKAPSNHIGPCRCDFCYKACERFVYHCSCGFNLHIKCAFFTYDIAEKKLKELELVALKDPLISLENYGENCYACWEPLAKYAYFSPDCGFNLHKKCADLPLKINDMGHEHPLALQFNSKRHLFCKICQGVNKAAGFKYCCSTSSCNNFVHIDCVEVKNHQHPLQLLNEQEEVIQNFHAPQNPLQLQLNDEQISSNQSRVGGCSRCGEKVSAPSLGCVECGFYIHQKCAEARLEIFHPFHPDHPLLLKKIPYGYAYDDDDDDDDDDECFCHFCEIACERFFYHCSCGLDFHIKCALFTYNIAEKKLKELELVAVRDPLISPENNGEKLQKRKCFACWEPLAKYAYFSPDCGFNLHKKCADLPLEINDMGHEHPLALQFNGKRHLFCKICQGENKAAGFKYCCSISSCYYFVHTGCAEVKNHLHPLQLLNEQGIQTNLIPPAVDDNNNKVGWNSEQITEDKIHTHSKKRSHRNIKGSEDQASLELVKKDEKNFLKKPSARRIGQEAQSNKRRKSSSVWDEFTEKQNGVGNIRAICAHCEKDFDGSSKKGTTHLRNHLERCKPRATKIRDQQLMTFPVERGDLKNESAREGPSSFDPAKIGDSTTRDTNERNSMFDQDRSRLDFARMIIKHHYLLDMAEQEYFRTFLKNLQPEFEFQPPEIILSDIDRIYAEEKEKLHRYFDQLACSFSLTVSLWKENLGKNAYCCLIAQFIDDDWKLKKKILAFKSLGHMYDTGTLAGIIRSSISEWNMGSKVCSITVDGSSFNDDIVQQIKEYSSHCFISCGTLIRDGFCELDYILLKLRKSIEYVSETPQGKLKFQEAANQAKLQCGKSRDDLSLRLDSDFGILDSALKSREIFCQLEKIDGDFRVSPSIEEWDKAQALHGCLEGFYDILSISKGTQSLTSNLYFPRLCDTYKKFLQLDKSDLPFVALMKGKFDHYWSLCNLVFAVAAVLDPRLKFKIVEVAYDGIYGRESQAHFSRFRKFLMDVYYEYECANIKPRNLTASSSAFGEFSSSTRQSTQIDGSILDSFRKHASASNSNEVAPWKSELDRYLEEPSLPLNEESFFDILCWWRDTSERFPTLGMMACDFLVMPVSVVATCSDFSAMILNPSYSRLNPNSMEALMCTQNWLEMPKGNGRDNYAPMENKMVTLPLENVLQEGKPLKSSPKLQYIHCFPLGIHEYIHGIIDVKADGHCGFRSIAGLLGMGSDCWSQVRQDLIEELGNFQEHYVSLYGSIEHAHELLQAISWFETPAPYNKWMAMPDMGHLIASRYNVVLVHISTKQCLTFLPLRSVPSSPPEHKIIVIGFVSNNHFVQVLMDPVSPIPSIAPEWRKHRYHCAREWESPYIARIEAFKLLCAKNSNVTCQDTIYLDVP